MSSTPQPAALTLEELVALNDEIAALVRAGIPLELGLQAIGSSVRGGLAVITERLAVEMSRGATLPQALEAVGDGLPAIYRAIVESGLKTGRLPAALECLTALTRELIDMRQRIGLALLYPAMVLVTAYVFFVAFIAYFVPELVAVFHDFRLSLDGPLGWLLRLHETVRYWAPVAPLVSLALSATWFLTRRQAFGPQRRSGELSTTYGWIGPFGWLPWCRSIVRNFEYATFANLLALLLDYRVPLHDALRLAGDSTGSGRLARNAERVAKSVETGKSLPEAVRGSNAFPAFLTWMMCAGDTPAALLAALRQAAEHYRRRAGYQAEWFKLLLPVALVLLVGGSATLIYAMSLFLPLSQFLKEMSQ